MGTAVLVASINLSRGKPVAIGLALMAAILMFGPICGGHYNPAVTMGVLINERKCSNFGYALGIMLSQLCGAVLGCAIAYFSQQINEKGVMTPGIAILCPARPVEHIGDDGLFECAPLNFQHGMNLVLAEAFGTFCLVAFILQMKYFHGESTPVPVIAFGVGLTLTALIIMCCDVSGAALNPAVGLIQSMFQFWAVNPAALEEGHKPSLDSMWIYIVGPMTGGVAAGLWSLFMRNTQERAFKEQSANVKQVQYASINDAGNEWTNDQRNRMNA